MGIPGWVIITETGSVFHSDTGEVPPEYPNAKVITVAEFVRDVAAHVKPLLGKFVPDEAAESGASDA